VPFPLIFSLTAFLARHYLVVELPLWWVLAEVKDSDAGDSFAGKAVLSPPQCCCVARSESWGTFKYMTQQSHWNWAVQHSVRFAGSVLMWQIGRRMPEKYKITGGLWDAFTVLFLLAHHSLLAVG
jgi:hypothetical protein